MRIMISIQDEHFIYDIIPKIISKVVKDAYIKKAKENQTSRMDDYLMSVYNVDTKDVVNNIETYIYITKNGKTFIVGIGNNAKGTEILRIIDYGNITIKGLNLIGSSLMYVKYKLNFMYNLYEKGGLIYGD